MTFQYPIKNLVLSHSTRSSARRCMRLLEFGKLFGDGEGQDEQYASECGKALHAGFQNFLMTKDENKALFAFLLAFPFELEYTDPKHSARSLEACYATLMELIRSPIVDQYELIKIKVKVEDKDEEKYAIEVPFAIEIINSPMPIPIYFVGFIDAILYDRRSKRYIVTDIKTTRLKILDYSTRYEFDEQTVPYAIVLEHLLGVEITELDVSYLSAYIDLEEPKVSLYHFKKSQDYVSDWYRGLCDDISRIARYYKMQWFPRATNGDTCFSFNRPCYFADYCSNRDPETISKMLGNVIREGLFRNNEQPWVFAKLEWSE